MKASKFSNAQKEFILKQGDDGVPVAEICRKAGISQATYFNWRKKYAGLLPDEMRRLKALCGCLSPGDRPGCGDSSGGKHWRCLHCEHTTAGKERASCVSSTGDMFPECSFPGPGPLLWKMEYDIEDTSSSS